MRHRMTVRPRDDVAVEHHQALAELQNAAMPVDRAGLGLLGMQERAALIGGKVEIESSPGNGTTVYVRVPVSVGG